MMMMNAPATEELYLSILFLYSTITCNVVFLYQLMKYLEFLPTGSWFRSLLLAPHSAAF